MSMKVFLNLAFILLVAQSVFANKPVPKLSAKKYLEWYFSSENKYISEKVLGEYSIRIILIPSELEFAKCAVSNCVSESELKSDFKEANRETQPLTFLLEISKIEKHSVVSEDPKNEAISYEEIVKWVKKDFKLITRDGEVLTCKNLIIEPILPTTKRLVIDFEQPKGSITQVLLSKNILSENEIQFEFPILDIKDLPKLKL